MRNLSLRFHPGLDGRSKGYPETLHFSLLYLKLLFFFKTYQADGTEENGLQSFFSVVIP